MSLVKFHARNHRQQVLLRGPDDAVDDRATTLETFEPLHERFDFTVDVAANAINAKLPRFFSFEDDGLAMSWAGESVWCNPPYSNIYPWIEKAWHEYESCRSIVMLLPANRTEQGWWQDGVEPYRDRAGSPLRVEFLRGRLRFIAQGRTEVGPNERPPFGCCLLIWSSARSAPAAVPRSLEQLERCAEAGDASGAVLCADHHPGYSQPIGGVVAYRDSISPSGVGYDIACGNKAVRTNLRVNDIRWIGDKPIGVVMDEIVDRISFGVGRSNKTKVDDTVIDRIRDSAFAPQRQLVDLAATPRSTTSEGLTSADGDVSSPPSPKTHAPSDPPLHT